MDPRRRKLRVALWILGLGTLIALAWHGWVLGRGYPDNTYVYIGQSHFTDRTGVVQFSALPANGRVISALRAGPAPRRRQATGFFNRVNGPATFSARASLNVL